MADFRARQRIQIHDGTDEFAVTSGKPIFVSLSDGTDTSLIDGSGNLNVILAANSGTDIGDVDVASVPAPLNVVGGGTEATALRVTLANDSTGLVSIDDGGGTITVDGTVSITGDAVDDAAFTIATDKVMVIGAIADEAASDSVDEGDQGAIRMGLDRILLVRPVANSGVDIGDVDVATIAAGDNNIGNVDIVTVPAPLSTTGGGTEATALRVTIANDSTGTVTVDDGGSTISIDGTLTGITNDVNIADGGNTITVDASNLDIRTITKATDSIQISKDTSANSETNPIFVKTVDTLVSASEIHDYDTSSAIAKDASDNHDYSVANATFLLKSVIVSASGAMKCEIQAGPSAALVTKAVAFTSAAKPTEQVVFDPPIEVPTAADGTVRIIRRNDDNSSMDVYSTIIGQDI